MNFKAREACDYLGVDLDTLKIATKHRDVAHTKLSERRTVYAQADLDAWKATWKRVEVKAKN